MAAEVQGHDTREQIVRAAEDVIADVGMRAATTKAIAQRAGCAEGSIYRYFADKHALFMEIAKRQFPTFIDLVGTFPERAGTGTVEGNLRELAVAATEFYRAIVPMACGVMAEHSLLEEQRRHFDETQSGPMKAVRGLTEYIRREQELGRISADASPPHFARLLFGACFGHAFLSEMVGPVADLEPDADYASRIVELAVHGVVPRREPKHPGT